MILWIIRPQIFNSSEGKKRSAAIPDVLHMSVNPLPTAHPSGEMWANTGHPVSPEKLAFAMGAPGNTFNDHGMRWDNSGKNGHYAPIPQTATGLPSRLCTGLQGETWCALVAKRFSSELKRRGSSKNGA
jgi:hypothetical protein